MRLSYSSLKRETDQAFADRVCPPPPPPALGGIFPDVTAFLCSTHTTRSLFTAEQPVTLPGPHSAETLASDPVAMATPPDVSLLLVAEVGAVMGYATRWWSEVG